MDQLATHTPSEVLTKQSFVSRIVASHPSIVVFDCDGTLWAGDAGAHFLTWSIEQGIVSRDTADWILGRYASWESGQVSQADICGDMARMYAGVRDTELRAAAKKFYREHIAPQIFPEMLALSQQLASQGVALWAVSSTNRWVIEEAVRLFGIHPEHVLAASTQVRDGVATDMLSRVPTGEWKRRELESAGVSRPDAVLGNSIHDAEMLEMAAAAYAVNPTPALLELAAANHWPVYWPDGTQKAV